MERGRLQSRPRSAVFGAVALIAAVLVAGCGDDGGSTDSEAKADFKEAVALSPYSVLAAEHHRVGPAAPTTAPPA